MFQKIKKIRIKTILLFLIFQIVFISISMPLAVFYGPFENVKNTVVGMSWKSLSHRYIARFFLSDDDIKTILSKNTVLSNSSYSKDVEVLKFGKTDSDRIDVYSIDGGTFKGKVMVIYNPKKVVVGYSSKIPDYGETTSEIAKRNKAVAAINAGGFSYNDETGKNGMPMGFIFHNGKLVYNKTVSVYEKRDTAAITSDGALIVGLHSIFTLKKYGTKEAISFGPPLIVNGKPSIKSGDGGWGIAPRTAIAQTYDGKIIFIVIDGRRIDSAGATLKDVQDILLDFNAVNAVNLDGGSSTAMFFNGKIINQTANPLGEREVPSVFMVVP